MKIRIIYDAKGTIISRMQGSDLYTPVGVPYLDIEVPMGKYVTGIDVSKGVHTPIFVDLPKSETQQLKDENIEIKLALAELAELVAGGTA